jgi:tetratricopeptide (TPR) repeat protein
MIKHKIKTAELVKYILTAGLALQSPIIAYAAEKEAKQGAMQEISVSVSYYDKKLEDLLGIDSRANISSIYYQIGGRQETQNDLKKIIQEAKEDIRGTGKCNINLAKSIFTTINDRIKVNGQNLNGIEKTVVYLEVADQLKLPIQILYAPDQPLLLWSKTDVIIPDEKDLAPELRSKTPIANVIFNPQKGEFAEEKKYNRPYGRTLNRTETIAMMVNEMYRERYAKIGDEAIFQAYAKGKKEDGEKEAEQYFRSLITKDAIQKLYYVTQLFPEYVQGYNGLVFSLVKKAEMEKRPECYEMAIKTCDRGLQLDPGNLCLLYNRATAKIKMGKTEEGLKDMGQIENKLSVPKIKKDVDTSGYLNPEDVRKYLK